MDMISLERIAILESEEGANGPGEVTLSVQAKSFPAVYKGHILVLAKTRLSLN